MPPAQSVGFKPSKRQLNGWRVRSWHDDLLALSCVAVGGSRLGYYKPIHWTAPSWQLEKFLCNEPHLAGFELTGSAEVLNSTLRIVERRLLRFAVTFSHWRMGFFACFFFLSDMLVMIPVLWYLVSILKRGVSMHIYALLHSVIWSGGVSASIWWRGFEKKLT